MTTEDRQKLKIQIVQILKELRKTIESLKESSKIVQLDEPIGRLTRMDAIGNKSISKASLNSAKARIPRLESALKRIEEDDFGICVGCDEEIPYKRLLLMPETVNCVNCAE